MEFSRFVEPSETFWQIRAKTTTLAAFDTAAVALLFRTPSVKRLQAGKKTQRLLRKSPETIFRSLDVPRLSAVFVGERERRVMSYVDGALLQTDCPDLTLICRGKVRDIYSVEGCPNELLFIATDRISAFDVIMKNGIPNKGKLLTSLSLFFFNYLANHPDTRHIGNHVITADIDEMPEQVQVYKPQLEGRAIWVKRAEVLPVEAIVRGYITGSAWSEYSKSGTMHDMILPPGLLESTQFIPPLFTPSTKAEVGKQDINIHPNKLQDILGSVDLAQHLSAYAVALYTTAAAHSISVGLILADTKFEFGLLAPPASAPAGTSPTLILVDECLTPDSSRFWPASTWAAGNKMVGFDKQFLREWLKEGGGGFGKKGGGIEEDAVEIPKSVVDGTMGKYEEAYELLTGKKFVP